MDDERQKTQVELALATESTGEAQTLERGGTESPPAKHETESLAEGQFHQPLNLPNRRVRTRTHGGVGGVEPRGLPLSRFGATTFRRRANRIDG